MGKPRTPDYGHFLEQEIQLLRDRRGAINAEATTPADCYRLEALHAAIAALEALQGLDVVTDATLCAALPAYNGWRAFYEHPGNICYRHPAGEVIVRCTSDWERPDTLDVQIETIRGVDDGGGDVLPWPRQGRTWGALFALVRRFLDDNQPACGAVPA